MRVSHRNNKSENYKRIDFSDFFHISSPIIWGNGRIFFAFEFSAISIQSQKFEFTRFDALLIIDFGILINLKSKPFVLIPNQCTFVPWKGKS